MDIRINKRSLQGKLVADQEKFCVDRIIGHIRCFISSDDLESMASPTQRDASQNTTNTLDELRTDPSKAVYIKV